MTEKTSRRFQRLKSREKTPEGDSGTPYGKEKARRLSSGQAHSFALRVITFVINVVIVCVIGSVIAALSELFDVSERKLDERHATEHHHC